MSLVSETSTEHPLSPMQAGMLFESLLYSSDGAPTFERGYNVEQLVIRVPEALAPDLIARAFTLLSQRHPILRTRFQWEGLATPVQSAVETFELQVTPIEGDHDELEGDTLNEFLRRDRMRGFDLRAAPLQRLALLRAGERSVLVWTFHHILLDGRSFAPLLIEAFEAYAALRSGAEPAWSAAPRPYAEFLHWVAANDTSAGRDYFRALLAGKATPTPLPGAEPVGRPLPRQGYAEHSLRMSAAALEQLKQLAALTSSTLANVVQAGWALVLSRFTQDEDVVFGTTRACRRSALDGETEQMVGLFINTLPIRVQISAEHSVAALLQELRVQSLAAREHEHTPLGEIQKESVLPAGVALFQTLVMFENRELNQSLQQRGGDTWKTRTVELHEQPSLPLSVTVFQSDELELRFLFDRRRFADATIDRLAASLEAALCSLAFDPAQSLAAVEVLPAAERERILFDWNATTRPFPEDLCIHHLFEQRAQLQPDAIAVEFKQHVLTYADLDAWANRIARLLSQRGVAPGNYVGICLERGLYLVAAMLAVAKSGAAYVPLDPAYPVDRIRFMLEDVAAPIVITETQHLHLFDTEAVVVDGNDSEAIRNQSSAKLAESADPGDVCYAIFTSGSTGRPKGVVLTHRAVVNTFDWVSRNFRVVPGDRLLWVTSPCFDLSVYDTFGALGAGATVVIASSALLKDAQALAQSVVDNQITIWDSAPAALQRLVPFFPTRAARKLRLVMLSGDWIPLSLPDAVCAAFPNAKVKSLGGATEAAIWSNWFDIEEIDPRWASIPYGRPIQNSRYHVLDSRLEPVPVGVAGDLYIGGVCLAEGYLKRPELTLERFIPDPFSGNDNERLYRTGDLARYFDDGHLEFLGRADFQVKIRGFRVETGEVEAALTQLPAVDVAVCTTFLDASGQRSLVAYVVPKAGQQIDGNAIKLELGSTLPEFMVPSYVIELPTLPLSPNGKVDRKALPSPSERGPDSKAIAPRTDLELQLQSIWERVLRQSPIGMRDNFFDLGGHSLLAVVLMSEVKRELGKEVALSRIIECPTIETLARAIDPNTALAPLNQDSQVLKANPQIQVLNQAGPTPFFLIHDGDGEILLYRTLAKQLPPSFSGYGIVPLTRPGVPLAHLSLTELAAHYVGLVRRLQPEGKYYLGGLCAGGVIAFEMAQQLSNSGAQVALVAIMDAMEPTTPVRSFREARRRWNRLGRLWLRARGNSSIPPSSRMAQSINRPTGMASLFRSLVYKVFTTLWYAVASRFARFWVSLRLGLLRLVLTLGMAWPQMVDSLSVREIYTDIKRRYVPKPATIERVILIKATQGYGVDEPVGGMSDDPLLGWRRFVDGDLQAIEVPGGHSSMLQEPYVQGVASVLKRFLEPMEPHAGEALSRISVASFAARYSRPPAPSWLPLAARDASSYAQNTSVPPLNTVPPLHTSNPARSGSVAPSSSSSVPPLTVRSRS